jgi:hypothetical protein
MLRPKSPQESFYGSYLYDRIVPVDHLLRKINQVVDFSFAGEILKDPTIRLSGGQRKTPSFCFGCAYCSISTVIPIGR